MCLFLPFPDYGGELLPYLLQSKLILLLDHHDASLLVVPGNELRLPMGKEDRVWEQYLATLDFLVWREQVLNQLRELDLLAREDREVYCLPYLKLGTLYNLSLAYITETAEV